LTNQKPALPLKFGKTWKGGTINALTGWPIRSPECPYIGCATSWVCAGGLTNEKLGLSWGMVEWAADV